MVRNKWLLVCWMGFEFTNPGDWAELLIDPDRKHDMIARRLASITLPLDHPVFDQWTQRM